MQQRPVAVVEDLTLSMNGADGKITVGPLNLTHLGLSKACGAHIVGRLAKTSAKTQSCHILDKLGKAVLVHLGPEQ